MAIKLQDVFRIYSVREAGRKQDSRCISCQDGSPSEPVSFELAVCSIWGSRLSLLCVLQQCRRRNGAEDVNCHSRSESDDTLDFPSALVGAGPGWHGVLVRLFLR